MATLPVFEGVLARMYRREGEATLPEHLAARHGITVTKLSRLDVGVYRVDRAGKEGPLVARMFSVERPHAAAAADLAVLRYLAAVDFRAERPFGDGALSSHQGQAVLVSEFVKQVAKPHRPAYPIRTLGAMIGRLHGLPTPAGAQRRAGALHHFAEGTMADELHEVARWLDAMEALVPRGGSSAFDALRSAVHDADSAEGLPQALIHPDPVPKNAVFTAAGPVMVDWTSAGRGSRLASITLVLQSGWAAVPFMKGYTKVVALTDDERGRLRELLFSRALVRVAYNVPRDPESVLAIANAAACQRGQGAGAPVAMTTRR